MLLYFIVWSGSLPLMLHIQIDLHFSCTPSTPFTLCLLSLPVPSIQRQKARVLLVCGQIRAALARFWWEGARRRPVLQLWEPIGAEQNRGREGGSESKKICKQMETLRILGERSRDGSTDMDVCYFYLLPVGPFFWGWAGGTEEEYQERKASVSQIKSVFFFHGWSLHKLFVSDQLKTTSEYSEVIFWIKDILSWWGLLLFMYAQLNGIAHVYMLVMCNHFMYAWYFFIRHCVLSWQTWNVCNICHSE